MLPLENELRELFNQLSLEEKLGEFNQIPGEYFQDVTIATGENPTLNFPKEIVDMAGSALNVETPEFIINVDLEYIWEPGEIKVFIGHDSRVSKSKSFNLVK